MTARRISVSLRAPERVMTGEKIRCTVAVRCSGWMAGCDVVCAVDGQNSLTGEVSDAEVPVLRTGTGMFEAESSRCGQLLLRVRRIEARDWFGIARFVREPRAEVSALIVPDLYPVYVQAETESGSCCRESGGSRRRAEDPEPGDLRPYLPGDDVRRIHWKLSEKTDRTLILESVPEALDMAALMLETAFPDRNDPEAMHAAVQALLSVSHALAEKGITHAVITEQNGGTVMTEVADSEDFLRGPEQVLTAESIPGGISIGTLSRQTDGERRFRRAVIFSPHPYTDVSTPAERQPVTLVLPAFVPFTGSGNGIRVIGMDPADARIDI